MKETVFISFPIEDLQTVIIDCVNSCLKYNKQVHSEQPTETDRWFDLNELCIYHPDKPSKPTVYGWVNAGTIPVHKGGKKLRFLKSEIDNWLKQGRKNTLVEEIASEADAYLKSDNANILLAAGWISVNERLPYKDGDSQIMCLVYDKWQGEILVRPYNECHKCWDDEDKDDFYTQATGGHITHWMELPCPPACR